MRLKRMSVYAVAVYVLAVAFVAQAQNLCETLRLEAFNAMKENCEGVEGLIACYGFDSLTATFNEETDSDEFRNPSDLVDLFNLHTIHTQAFDEEEEEWGIGYFRIPLEGIDEPLVLIIAGDVIVENAVEPDEEDELSPMQAFNFETAGQGECSEAPNAVFIQAPQGVEVDLRINSIPARIGSTIVLGTEPGEDDEDSQTLWFGVLEGHLTTNPGTDEEQTVPAGNYTSVEIAADEEDGELVAVVDPVTGVPILGPNDEHFYRRVPIADFSEPEPITLDGEGFAGWDDYDFINDIPETLISYPIAITQTCLVVPIEGLTELRGHIGPGRNRSVRTFLDINTSYTAYAESDVEGVIWYQVSSDSAAEIWVSGEDVTFNCEAEVIVPETTGDEVCVLIAGAGVTELRGHVGPGRNRSVRTFLDLAGSYTSYAESDVEGVTWYQVSSDPAAEIWVSGEDVETSCEAATDSAEVEATATNAFPTWTATATLGGPTFTPSSTPTITPTVFGTFTPTQPGALPTDTPLPQPTQTPLPQPTQTPLPQPTQTPLPPPTDTPIPAPTTPAPVNFSGSVIGCVAGAGTHDVTFSFDTIPPGLESISFVSGGTGYRRTYTGNPMTLTFNDSELPITSLTAYAAGDVFLGSGGVSGSCP